MSMLMSMEMKARIYIHKRHNKKCENAFTLQTKVYCICFHAHIVTMMSFMGFPSWQFKNVIENVSS